MRDRLQYKHARHRQWRSCIKGVTSAVKPVAGHGSRVTGHGGEGDRQEPRPRRSGHQDLRSTSRSVPRARSPGSRITGTPAAASRAYSWQTFRTWIQIIIERPAGPACANSGIRHVWLASGCFAWSLESNLADGDEVEDLSPPFRRGHVTIEHREQRAGPSWEAIVPRQPTSLANHHVSRGEVGEDMARFCGVLTKETDRPAVPPARSARRSKGSVGKKTS
jgi:hypothetical protein